MIFSSLNISKLLEKKIISIFVTFLSEYFMKRWLKKGYNGIYFFSGIICV